MTLFAMLTLAVAVGPIAWLARAQVAGLRNEPHLHVSAVAADSPEPWRQAAGVPFTLDGRFCP